MLGSDSRATIAGAGRDHRLQLARRTLAQLQLQRADRGCVRAERSELAHDRAQQIAEWLQGGVTDAACEVQKIAPESQAGLSGGRSI